MLDTLFKMMAQDGYADWRSNVRLQTTTTPIDFSYPHNLADGQYLLRKLMPSLLALANQSLSDGSRPSELLRVEKTVSVTRFQSFLKVILTTDGTANANTVAVAVALSEKDHPLLNGQRNQVAFPIFTRVELLSLLEMSPMQWLSELKKRAVAAFQDYIRVGEKLESISPERRMRLYPKFPLNQCDLLITYLGDLQKMGLNVGEKQLGSIHFAGSSTNGPKQIWSCYSIGSLMRAAITEPKPFSWESVSYLEVVCDAQNKSNL